MKNQLIVFAFFLGTIIPAVALAQPNTAGSSGVSIITNCWTQDECDKAVPPGEWDNTSADAKKCSPDKDNTPRGLCLSINPDINLQLSLPGQGGPISTVKSFAEYISIFYKFFVAMIAVMSVVLIMWGGFKLIYRGGSAPAVTDAKEQIFGAIAALVIALLSYSLLNLVNPQLVLLPDLRLPRIKPDFFGFQCPNKPEYPCGLAATLENERACIGQYCGSTGQGCFPNLYGGDTNKKCIGGDRHGSACTDDAGCPGGGGCATINYACSNVLMQGSIQGIEVNYIDLMIICNDASIGHSCAINPPNASTGDKIDVEGNNYYAIQDCFGSEAPAGSGNYSSLRRAYCSSSGGLKGYALLIEVEGGGGDDWYAVDKACSSVGSVRITDSDGKDNPIQSVLDWPFQTDLIDWTKVQASKLFQYEDLFDAGGNMKWENKCNLNISRFAFPDRD